MSNGRWVRRVTSDREARDSNPASQLCMAVPFSYTMSYGSIYYIETLNSSGVFRMTELIGLLAAILTTASFLPQAILVVRTRNTEGISLAMYILFTIGVAGWFAYGLLIESLPNRVAERKHWPPIIVCSWCLLMSIMNLITFRSCTNLARRRRWGCRTFIWSNCRWRPCLRGR